MAAPGAAETVLSAASSLFYARLAAVCVMVLFDTHREDLARLAGAGRLRRLMPRLGRDFSSNDYLGLASAPRLAQALAEAVGRGVPLGSGGSRLLRGNHSEHEALEAEAAAFFGCETALFFGSGYAANSTLLSTLPQLGDIVIHDALIHASAHDGLRLGRASCRAVPHNDVDAFADAVRAWRRGGAKGQVWIAVESLYSMDGDRAPLDELVSLADRHDAILLIDEAHATGVYGPDGRGLAADYDGRENIIVLRTCGKALGCEGALLCGPAIMRDMLVNRGRGFIFSTAPSPLSAAAVRAALQILVEEPERRHRLHALAARASDLLAPCGAVATGSQILPLILGDEQRTMRVAAGLQKAGFDVRGIRPPTVAAGTSRLRVSITLNVSQEDIETLAVTLDGLLQ